MYFLSLSYPPFLLTQLDCVGNLLDMKVVGSNDRNHTLS